MNAYPLFVQKLLSKQIRFAVIMSILAFVMGLVYREFSRPFFANLSLEQQMLYGHDMSLVHGHTFLLGAVLPIVMAVLTFLVASNLPEKRVKNMNIRFTAYMVASGLTLAFMLYKGLAFIIGAGQPLDVVNASLFFGSPLLRGILIGASHVTLFWAVGEYLAGIFKAAGVKTPAQPAA